MWGARFRGRGWGLEPGLRGRPLLATARSAGPPPQVRSLRPDTNRRAPPGLPPVDGDLGSIAGRAELGRRAPRTPRSSATSPAARAPRSLDRHQLRDPRDSRQPHPRRERLAASIAIKPARALFTVSSNSLAGSLASTRPAPAWRVSFPSRATQVRIAIARSAFPSKPK